MLCALFELINYTFSIFLDHSETKYFKLAMNLISRSSAVIICNMVCVSLAKLSLFDFFVVAIVMFNTKEPHKHTPNYITYQKQSNKHYHKRRSAANNWNRFSAIHIIFKRLYFSFDAEHIFMANVATEWLTL